MNDSLGNRIKMYEKIGSASDKMMPGLPVIVRLDGKAFHTFTKGFERPFDSRLTKLMIECTKYLVEYADAKIGYTQSDEITLVLYADGKTQMMFDGKRDKLNSVLASACSVYFNHILPFFLPEELEDKLAIFDCRAFSVPSFQEAVNCLIWREQDAKRNSIQIAGQSKFSHTQLQGKSCDDIQEMLFQKHEINWNDYPAFFKRGTYVQRREIHRKFSTEEIEKLPPKHEARANPDLIIKRSEIKIINAPPLTRVLNQKEMVFDGVDPIINNNLE